jgi:hypothetical protein
MPMYSLDAKATYGRYSIGTPVDDAVFSR